MRIDRDQIELDAILFGDFEVEKKKKKEGKTCFSFPNPIISMHLKERAYRQQAITLNSSSFVLSGDNRGKKKKEEEISLRDSKIEQQINEILPST